MYITSALITVPPDYQQHWSLYRLELTGGRQTDGRGRSRSCEQPPA